MSARRGKDPLPAREIEVGDLLDVWDKSTVLYFRDGEKVSAWQEKTNQTVPGDPFYFIRNWHHSVIVRDLEDFDWCRLLVLEIEHLDLEPSTFNYQKTVIKFLASIRKNGHTQRRTLYLYVEPSCALGTFGLQRISQ